MSSTEPFINSGRKRIYSLESFIRFFILQKIIGIDTDSAMLRTLSLSKELRDFCGFVKVPDASKITLFKQQFCDHLADFFHRLVDITEPICRELDDRKADYLVFDTTGFELPVAENNPKFFNTKLKQAKALHKSQPNFNPYAGVYSFLPDTANKCINAKQQYINGHFCYAVKAAIVTNGLGIPRHIQIFDDDFKAAHPDIVEAKTDNPDIDKEISDSTALKPVLSNFFKLHPDLAFKTFIGDSAFDSYDNYSALKNDFHFERACIPINIRNSKRFDNNNGSAGQKPRPVSFDKNGIPLCPLDGSGVINPKVSGVHDQIQPEKKKPVPLLSANLYTGKCQQPSGKDKQ